MQKVLKILSLIMIIFMVMFYCESLYAINMNLDNGTTNDALNTDSSSNDVAEDADNTVNTNLSSENGTRGNFTTQITVSTQELTISNALSICLIAVGIVIILLAIAILIKLK